MPRDMAKRHKLDHKGSDGSTVADRVKRAGYVYVRVGENIADGQKTVDQVMDSWMKSPGHRANILAEFTEMGAARVEDDEGVNYWCVNFGAPMPRLKPDEAAAAVIKEINRDRETAKSVPLKADPRLRPRGNGLERRHGRQRQPRNRRRPVQDHRREGHRRARKSASS